MLCRAAWWMKMAVTPWMLPKNSTDFLCKDAAMRKVKTKYLRSIPILISKGMKGYVACLHSVKLLVCIVNRSWCDFSLLLGGLFHLIIYEHLDISATKLEIGNTPTGHYFSY